jgi:hypothetical protein
MQTVTFYLRRAKEARASAENARSLALKEQFRAIADSWERLAKERLTFLNTRIRPHDAEPSSS